MALNKFEIGDIVQLTSKYKSQSTRLKLDGTYIVTGTMWMKGWDNIPSDQLLLLVNALTLKPISAGDVHVPAVFFEKVKEI